MYVNPFWFGVFTTVFAELVVFLGFALFIAFKRGK